MRGASQLVYHPCARLRTEWVLRPKNGHHFAAQLIQRRRIDPRRARKVLARRRKNRSLHVQLHRLPVELYLPAPPAPSRSFRPQKEPLPVLRAAPPTPENKARDLANVFLVSSWMQASITPRSNLVSRKPLFCQFIVECLFRFLHILPIALRINEGISLVPRHCCVLCL